ncbi:unnamed protein product [Schistocephalus solidus]|uniref:Nuclear pore protein n=1 Tax=Schistocephalus solidus TaxID=70667 RepID=A0A183SPD0_SCHSO|nr:unnamed protein product [Schistocephalus solidus]
MGAFGEKLCSARDVRNDVKAARLLGATVNYDLPKSLAEKLESLDSVCDGDFGPPQSEMDIHTYLRCERENLLLSASEQAKQSAFAEADAVCRLVHSAWWNRQKAAILSALASSAGPIDTDMLHFSPSKVVDVQRVGAFSYAMDPNPYASDRQIALSKEELFYAQKVSSQNLCIDQYLTDSFASAKSIYGRMTVSSGILTKPVLFDYLYPESALPVPGKSTSVFIDESKHVDLVEVLQLVRRMFSISATLVDVSSETPLCDLPLPTAITDRALEHRASPVLQSAFIARSIAHLETEFTAYLRAVVAANPRQAQLGGRPGTRSLVRAFLNVRNPVSCAAGDSRQTGFEASFSDVEDGLVDEKPVWPMIYYCLRCGALQDAINIANDAASNLGDFSEILKCYLKQERQLPARMVANLRKNYRRVVKSSRDPYKRLVYCLLGRCDLSDAHTEVAQSIDDFLWLRLSQVSVSSDESIANLALHTEGLDDEEMLTLGQFQTLLYDTYGEGHFDAWNQPLVYFKILCLSQQFEGALAFLARLEGLRSHAVHIAILLHTMKILILPQSLHSPLSSLEIEIPGANSHFTQYHSGPRDFSGRFGVAIALSQQANCAELSWEPVNERMAYVRLKSHFKNLSIVSVYAPTSAAEQRYKETFYSQLQALVEKFLRPDLFIVAGDWNGRAGRGNATNSHLIGRFGFGSQCENGERLLNFADQNRLLFFLYLAVTRVDSDPAGFRRLNFARLLLLYTRKFEVSTPCQALNYYYFLSDIESTFSADASDATVSPHTTTTPISKNPLSSILAVDTATKAACGGLFIQCVSELVIQTREFDLLLGTLTDGGIRQPGAINRFCSDNGPITVARIISTVAETLEARGQLLDAVHVYLLAGGSHLLSAVRLTNLMLVAVVSDGSSTANAPSANSEFSANPQTDRNAVLRAAAEVSVLMRLSGFHYPEIRSPLSWNSETYEVGRNLQRMNLPSSPGDPSAEQSTSLKSASQTLFYLLDLSTFFDLANSSQWQAALDHMDRLGIFPSSCNSAHIESKVAAYAVLPDLVRRPLSNALLQLMRCLMAKANQAKASSSSVSRFNHGFYVHVLLIVHECFIYSISGSKWSAVAGVAKSPSSSEARTRARALITFVGRIPQRMSGEVYARLSQLEMQLT